MTKRKSAKELLDKMSGDMTLGKEADQVQQFAVTVAIQAATYDALCGIEQELHDISYALTHVNRALMALAVQNKPLVIKEASAPETPPKDHAQ